MLQAIGRSAWGSLLFFILLAIGIRFFSFFPSVIDHDESTYLVIAEALLNGQTYFIDVIDPKPIGVFLIYAGLQLLVGKSIFLLRLAAALVLALTAFFLYKSHLKSGSSSLAAVASGVIYLVLNSIFTYYGVSPNTETFYNLFTALALWMWIGEKRLWLFLLAGLSLGVGFIIKYVVAFDALAFGLFMLWMAAKKEVQWGQTVIRASFMLIGFLIPFTLTLGYYQSIGQLEAFFFYTFRVSSRYPDAAVFFDYVKFFFDFNLRFFPVVLFAVLAGFSSKIKGSIQRLSWLWMALVWIVVLLPGKFFAHYCIQVMLPLSFLAGAFFHLSLPERPRWLRAVTSERIGLPLLGLLLLVNGFFQKIDYFDKPDNPRVLAEFLKENLKEDQTFYIGNYEQVLYFLTDHPSPIPYVHSSLIWNENHIQALMIDQAKVLRDLQSIAPQYVFMKKPYAYLPVMDWLNEEYTLVKTMGKEVFVYEKR